MAVGRIRRAEHGLCRLLGHEDVDLFTLLPAPAIEGLQVLSRAGKWVRLDAPPGSIVLIRSMIRGLSFKVFKGLTQSLVSSNAITPS